MLLAAWLWMTRDLYVTQHIAPDADPGRQLAFIVAHPLEFAAVLLDDVRRYGVNRLMECLGYPGRPPHSFGWLQLLVVAAVALFDGRRDIDLGARGRTLLVLVFATTYVSINAMNYLALRYPQIYHLAFKEQASGAPLIGVDAHPAQGSAARLIPA